MARPPALIDLAAYEAYASDPERLEPGVIARVRGGAGTGSTVRANVEAFGRWRLASRVLRDVSGIDLTTTVLGAPIELPVFCCPIGAQIWVHPDAELATAAAAMQAGTIFIRPNLATATPEAIGALGPGRRWQQCEMLPDRGALVRLAARVQDAGFEALCLTVDRAYKPRRPADLSYPRPENSLPVAPTDPSFTWRDVSALASSIGIPLVLKGISHPADARLAVESGAAAIVVSNHGGNQLDGARATLEVIGEISAAAEGRIDVLMDGGVRCGPDVVKALALGARAVGIGRPLMWGLAHSGASGVGDILTILRLELIDTLGLLGVASVAAVDGAVVRRHGCGCGCG